MTQNSADFVTVGNCEAKRDKCPGRNTLSFPTLVTIFIAMIVGFTGAYSIRATKAAELENQLSVLRATAEMRAEAQEEMQKDLKRVLQTVTEIKTRMEK